MGLDQIVQIEELEITIDGQKGEEEEESEEDGDEEEEEGDEDHHSTLGFSHSLKSKL